MKALKELMQTWAKRAQFVGKESSYGEATFRCAKELQTALGLDKPPPKLTKTLRAALEIIDSDPRYGRTPSEKSATTRLHSFGYIVRSDEYSWKLTLSGRAAIGYGLSDDNKSDFEANIKTLLHESRDALRLKGVDTTRVPFDCREGYYSEAFGMLRALVLLDLGKFGAVNIEGNVDYWFYELQKQVLKEEGFGGDNRCNRCFEMYGHDTDRPQKKPC